MLAGCAGSTNYTSVDLRLSDPPAHVKQCFNQVVKIPTLQNKPYASMTPEEKVAVNEAARKLIVKLRRSELSKSRCGAQMMKFYSSVKSKAEKRHRSKKG